MNFGAIGNFISSMSRTLFGAGTPSGEVSARESHASTSNRRKRVRDSHREFLSLEQVEKVAKKARGAAMYEYGIAHMREGDTRRKVAAEVARQVGVDERTVRKWASEIEHRGDALRKPGSGPPEKYNRTVINKIVDLNDMYGNQASSRDIAEVLKEEFGFGSHQREFFCFFFFL